MESAESKSFNQRQLRMMADTIDKFKRQELCFGDLIARLKGLYWALESPSKEWSEKFLSGWGALEVVNALALDRREQRLIPSPKKELDAIAGSPVVMEAVELIDRLVHAELQQN
jgi:hypothetical protein